MDSPSHIRAADGGEGLHAAGEDLGEQMILAGEVGVRRRGGDPRPAGDVADGEPVVPAVCDLVGGGVHQPLNRVCLLAAEMPADRCEHRTGHVSGH